MDKKPNRIMLVLSIFILTGIACNLTLFRTPTPIVFPTPDLTMTAIFMPTETSLPGVSPTTTIAPPTATGTPAPSDTAVPTSTFTALPPTLVPTNTSTPTQSLVGPGARPRYQLAAYYFTNPPAIDTNLEDWKVEPYIVEAVVFGKGDHKGAGDLSARVRVGWDKNYLYLGVRVIDDTYVQNASGANIYKGDSIEILLDTNVSADYYLASLSSDDYQLGISPGSPAAGQNMAAYLWYPASAEGPRGNTLIAARARDDGYVIEAAIPWGIFSVTPFNGQHFGFAFSVSDNDNPNQNVQQSMVSSSPIRVLTDPTTWGDLVLVQD